MWVAPSAGRDDAGNRARIGVQRVARLRNGCDSTSGSGSERRVAALRSRRPVDRHGFDTRHAGYFDGEWERP